MFAGQYGDPYNITPRNVRIRTATSRCPGPTGRLQRSMPMLADAVLPETRGDGLPLCQRSLPRSETKLVVDPDGARQARSPHHTRRRGCGCLADKYCTSDHTADLAGVARDAEPHVICVFDATIPFEAPQLTTHPQTVQTVRWPQGSDPPYSSGPPHVSAPNLAPIGASRWFQSRSPPRARRIRARALRSMPRRARGRRTSADAGW